MQMVSAPVIIGFIFTIIVSVVVKAHCPAFGVKVYMVDEVLSIAGVHEPA